MRGRSMFGRVAVTLIVGVAACTSDRGAVDPLGTATMATLRIESPHEDDRALLIEIDGAAVDRVTSDDPSHRVFVHAPSSSTTRIAIFGALGTDVILNLRVRDDVDEYGALLEEAAGPAGVLRDDLHGYTLSITN